MYLFRSLLAIFTILVFAVTPVSAEDREEWIEESLEFADDIEKYLYSAGEEEWDAYRQSIQPLPAIERIERYQDLGFGYLVGLSHSQYEKLKSDYKELLDTSGSSNQHEMQSFLDAFAEISVTGDYEATLSQLRLLADSNHVSDKLRLRALISLSYTEADNGARAASLRTLQRARNLARNIDITAPQIVELEALTAYILMGTGDFGGVIESWRNNIDASLPYGLPIEASALLSNFTWMFRRSG